MMDSDAVLPSSPPHASAAANIPSSPLLAPQYSATSLKSSSPPPLFSSDDSRESVDITNYQSPRIFKNKREGTWWENGESSQVLPDAKKTKITRNYDSGVYMMSDATDSSESLLPQHKSPFGPETTQDEPRQTADSNRLVPQKISDSDFVFNSILEHGLEKNAQSYDFSNLSLQDSDIQEIGQLGLIIRNVPDPGNDLPAEGQYRSMEAQVTVSLRDNSLRRLTPSLFTVQTLTYLDLRNNMIEELPAHFGTLCNLRHLDLSLNPIQSLPFDMLQLFCPGNLRLIADSGVSWLHHAARNYFALPQWDHWSFKDSLDATTLEDIDEFQRKRLEWLHDDLKSSPHPYAALWSLRRAEHMIKDRVEKRRHCLRKAEGMHNEDQEERIVWYMPQHAEGHEPLLHMANSLVSYYDEAGTIMKGSPVPCGANGDDIVALTPTERGVHGVPCMWYTPPPSTPLKSLSSMSILSALRHGFREGLCVADLRQQIGQYVPREADAVLTQAEENAAEGYSEFRTCHSCQKEYVIRRAEWVEWWNKEGSITYPFKVKVCSWNCVPDHLKYRPEKELRLD